MSAQELDVKRSWRALRRHRSVLAGCVFAGIVGGALVGALFPPLYAATSLIVLPPPPPSVSASAAAPATHSIETHVLIARSEPVLTSAGQNLDPPLEVDAVRDRVEVTAVTSDVLQVEGQATSAAQAITLTNAVAEIYLVFATTDQSLPGDLGVRRGARVLQEATIAHSGNPVLHYGLFAGLGGVAGALLGSLGVLIATRRDRRLHLRDEMANAVGIPVLASVASHRARSASDWADLLERYEPSAVDGWSFRRLLRDLGADPMQHDDDAGARHRTVSIAVVTFADDEKAVTLGPQLAAYAQAAGITTSLVVDAGVATTNALLGDPQTDLTVVTGTMQALNGDHHTGAGELALRVSMIVVDRSDPHLTEARRSERTIIGLSAGGVTAEDLARLAVLAAVDRREINGLVVLDPDPTDRTTGRVPDTVRPGNSRLPTTFTRPARKAAQ